MSDTEDTKQCTNCKLDILTSNYTVHFVHCQRNFYLCTKCQQPVNYSQRREHDEDNHVIVHCINCNLELEKCKLKEHSTNDCPYRKVRCQICDIEIKATNITEHENYCGSRTEKCSECGEFVMLRYKSLHIDSNHTFLKLSDEPGPSPSWQNGRRTLYNFLPDLSVKSHKPLSGHKRRSSERRSRNSESKDSVNLEDLDPVPTSSQGKTKNGEVDEKLDDFFQIKEVRKPIKKVPPFKSSNADECSALSGLKISEDISKISNCNEECEGFDALYGVKISQDLNSEAWKKECASGEDKSQKNCFKSTGDKIKEKPDKNLFKSKRKSFENDFNNFNTEDFVERRFEVQEPVKLPCEFCEVLIPSQDLILHQTRCSLFGAEAFDRRNSRHKFSGLSEDIEKKILCGVCNKFFKLTALENHQLHCQRNLTKSWKNAEKTNYGRNVKPMNVKSEPGIQNGVEQSSPRVSRVGTRSEWLSEISKATNADDAGFKNNLNRPEAGATTKTTKVSRKNKRAPSPPKM